MKPPLYYYPHMEMKYAELIDNQKRIAAVAKEKLMGFDPELVNKQEISSEFDDLKFEIANQARLYYRDAIFFHDAEALNKLKQLKLTTTEVKFENISSWFISLHDIHQQYEIIRRHNIKIDSLLAFNIIKAHLFSKFLKDILMEYAPTIRDETRISKLTKDLINLKNRRNYSGSTPKTYKNVSEILLNNAVNEFEKIPNDKLDFDLKYDIYAIINLSKGKTEPSYLKILLEECFAYDEKKISKTKFLSIVFDLLKLLMPDRNLKDEETFDNASHLTYKSYNSYKAQALKKILYRSV